MRVFFDNLFDNLFNISYFRNYDKTITIPFGKINRFVSSILPKIVEKCDFYTYESGRRPWKSASLVDVFSCCRHVGVLESCVFKQNEQYVTYTLVWYSVKILSSKIQI